MRACSWTTSPIRLHLDAAKSKINDFSADYRDFACYNNLPSYADPLLARGIVRTSSLTTRGGGSGVSSRSAAGLLGYSVCADDRDSGSGHGATGFVTDANQFPVPTTMSDLINLYRGGVRFERPKLHVMLATHGGGPVRRLLLGSVTPKVLHDLSAAVWTGTDSVLEGRTPPLPYKSVLCAVDETPEAEAAVRAAAFALGYGARLSLMHEVEGPPATFQIDFSRYEKELIDAADSRLRELKEKLGWRRRTRRSSAWWRREAEGSGQERGGSDCDGPRPRAESDFAETSSMPDVSRNRLSRGDSQRCRCTCTAAVLT